MSVEAECAITAQERVLRIRRHELRIAQWNLNALKERHAEELRQAETHVDQCSSLVIDHEKHLNEMIQDLQESES